MDILVEGIIQQSNIVCVYVCECVRAYVRACGVCVCVCITRACVTNCTYTYTLQCIFTGPLSNLRKNEMHLGKQPKLINHGNPVSRVSVRLFLYVDQLVVNEIIHYYIILLLVDMCIYREPVL